MLAAPVNASCTLPTEASLLNTLKHFAPVRSQHGHAFTMMDAALRIVYARDLADRYDTRGQHARAATAGRERRVARGAYIPADLWDELDARSKYLVRIRAVARTRRNVPLLSHWSAAAIHGLPVVGVWPNEVHVIVSATNGGRSRNGVIKHSLRVRDDDVVVIDGLLVTSVARTVVDIASCSSPLSAVAMADRALLVDRRGGQEPMVLRDQLRSVWESMLPFRGHARARDIIDFAESRSESPIESVSRYHMRVIGCPRPRLQTSFSDRRGYIGDTDFDWPEFGHLAEADGDVKYLDPSYRGGRTADQVVRDEKVREDRLRAVSRGFSRWRWEIAMRPSTLRGLLSDAGLPMGVPWVVTQV